MIHWQPFEKRLDQNLNHAGRINFWYNLLNPTASGIAYIVCFRNVNEYRIPSTFFSTGIPCVNSF